MKVIEPGLRRGGILAGLVAVLTGSVGSLLAVDEPDFYRDVYPFLKANCISCHNKTTTKAGLNMETPELMIRGGDSGAGIVPGKSGDSLIVEASVHSDYLEMPPPNNKSGAVNLTPAEIALLKTWIDQGAKSSVQEERQVTWKPLAPGVEPIYSVALSRDGRYAACGRSNRIFLYDLATRRLVGEIADPAGKTGTAHRAMVQSLAFSPDGTRLASGSFREVKVWRLAPDPDPKVAPAPEAAASPETVATPETAAAPDATGAPEPVPAPPSPEEEALLGKIAAAAKVAVLNHAESADGRFLVTGCADGSVRVWEKATAGPVIELRGSVSAAREMADLEWTVARQALEQAFQKTEITRIEAQEKALDELLKKARDAIVAMGKVLPEKQKLVKPAQDETAAARKEVDDVTALIAKATEGKPDAALEKQLRDAQEKLNKAATAENSALAAVSAAENNIIDAEAQIERITESKARNAGDLAAANAAIEAAKQAETGATTALAAARQAVARPTARPVAVALSDDGEQAAAFFDDGTLSVWATATGAPIGEAPGAAAPAVTLASLPDGAFVATRPDGSASRSAGSPRWLLERTLGGEADPSLFADRINAVRFSPDGKLLATGGGEPSRSGDVTLFEVATGKPAATWKDRHDDIVMCLDFSPDGSHLASGAADKIARVTEVATGRQVNLLEGHTHYVMGIAYRADGRVLATAGADGVVTSWNMILGERKKKIEGWTKEVTSIQFIGATNQIVTSAGDNLVRIVNDDGAQVRSIAGLPDFMQSAASTANGATLVGGGEDSFLRVWNGADGKEIAAFGIE